MDGLRYLNEHDERFLQRLPNVVAISFELTNSKPHGNVIGVALIYHLEHHDTASLGICDVLRLDVDLGHVHNERHRVANGHRDLLAAANAVDLSTTIEVMHHDSHTILHVLSFCDSECDAV
jgi:hypothetical protein